MTKNQKIAGIFSGMLLTVGVNAQAALPTAATDAFTSISGNVTDVLAAIWPIAALSVGGFVLLKLFKKGASKAV